MKTGTGIKEIFPEEGCRICPRECGAGREEGKRGVCGVADVILVSRAALHMWEEPCISGERGSGAVFFAGCPLHCVYCQNYEIAGGVGKVITKQRLAEIFLELQQKGAHNINLVTPTHYSHLLPEVLQMARDQGLCIPIVYNCSGYEKVDTLKKLADFVDIYLADYKYPDPQGAEKYSHAPDYPEIAWAALEEMLRQQPECVFDEEGILQKGVVVRHLLLPGRVKAAKQAVSQLYEAFGDRIYISLMNQYTPFERVGERYPELSRKVTSREYGRLLDFALELGVENGFFQEGDTAEESFIPVFNGEGV
ncbi:MAG: radical SAM protein [Lachnospiraceae bacterium]|nr:radical SAM protein [Lachnospiraceae bacterium]